MSGGRRLSKPLCQLRSTLSAGPQTPQEQKTNPGAPRIQRKAAEPKRLFSGVCVETRPRLAHQNSVLGHPRRGIFPVRPKILPRHWVRANLEVCDLALRALPAFNMPDEVGAVVRPEAAALPAGSRVVDAAIHTP